MYGPGSPFLNKELERNMKVDENFNMLTNATGALSGIPGVGTAFAVGGAALKLGDAIDKGSKDEFGVYKNDFTGKLNAVFNPATRFKGLMDGDITGRDVFTALNPLGGLIGYKKSQEEAKGRRSKFRAAADTTATARNAALGSAIRNQLPSYSPPQYG